MQRPTEDRFVLTKSDLTNRMVVLMAGRAAEQLVFGEISTGAADDLAKVTDIARELVLKFGMSEEVWQAVYERERAHYLEGNLPGFSPKDYSESTAAKIDAEVARLIDQAYGQAQDLLKTNRADLDAGTKLLLELETITPDEFAPLRQIPDMAA